MSERKQINFTIVPDDEVARPRTYANFCSISIRHSTSTLTFCEVLPPDGEGGPRGSGRPGVEGAGTGTDRCPDGIRPQPDQRVAGALAGLYRIRWEPGLGQAGRALAVVSWVCLPDDLRRYRSRPIRQRSPSYPARARSTASGRLHRVGVRNPYEPAGGHDPVGAVHRRAGEPGHPVFVRALSNPGGAGGGKPRWRSSPRSSRPASSASSPGHWSAWHRLWSSTTTAQCLRISMHWCNLPGVGRKTANVVLGHALGVPGPPGRPARATRGESPGIARSADPVVVERQLGAALPKARWTLASDTLILHGRRICKPRPLWTNVVPDNSVFNVTEGGHTSSPQGAGRPGRQTGARTRR